MHNPQLRIYIPSTYIVRNPHEPCKATAAIDIALILLLYRILRQHLAFGLAEHAIMLCSQTKHLLGAALIALYHDNEHAACTYFWKGAHG